MDRATNSTAPADAAWLRRADRRDPSSDAVFRVGGWASKVAALQ
jgi:hypothetical protein